MLVGDLEEIAIGRIGRAHEIHIALEKGFQILFECEEAIGDSGTNIVKLIEQIDVAAVGIESIGRGGAQQLHPFDAISATELLNGGAILFDDG